jgi:MFS family permease
VTVLAEVGRHTSDRRPLLALFAAVGISMGGNIITRVAIPWFVLQTTGEASRVGIAAFFLTVPVVIAGIFGGALIDRLGFRRTSILADVASAATIVLIPIMFVTIGLEFWMLLALVFLTALLDSPGETARSALLPDLAESAGMTLERATSIVDATVRIATMAGAALAGVLIAVVGATNILYVNSATFVVSAAIIAFAVPHAATSATEETESVGYFGEVRAGLTYLWNEPLIRAIVLLVVFTNFLDYANFAVVLPVYADEVLTGALDLGLLIATFGAGALVGNLAYGAFGSGLPRRALLIAAFLVLGARFLVLAAAPSMTVILVALLVCGTASGVLGPILSSALLERIPAAMRGRVIGALKASIWVLIPMGPLAGGYLVQLLGVRPFLVVLAVLYVAVTLAAAVRPALRELDTAADDASAGMATSTADVH